MAGCERQGYKGELNESRLGSHSHYLCAMALPLPLCFMLDFADVADFAIVADLFHMSAVLLGLLLLARSIAIWHIGYRRATLTATIAAARIECNMKRRRRRENILDAIKISVRAKGPNTG
jgi:hypothetical protein